MKKIPGLILAGLLLLFAACDDDDVIPDYNVIANAGPDQAVETGDEVILNGTASVDESGEGVQVSWTFESRPSESNAVIQNAGSIIAGFTLDTEGTYIVKLSITNNHGNSSDLTTITATDPVVTAAIEISGNITDDRVLEPVTPKGMADYIVTANIVVSGNLIVEPGVIVEFRSDTGMRIVQEGSIKAAGNQQDSIVFRGTVKVPGHWRGLRIDSNNTVNELSYMAIKHGGSDGIGSTTSERNRKANLIIISDGVRLKANNMFLAENSDHGLYLSNINNPTIELSNNIYTLNGKPVYADVSMFGLLDSESDYTGNTDDYIGSSDDRVLSSSATWPKLNVPFEIPGVSVDSDLKIEPGAQFLIAQTKGIYVRSSGSLNAVGEETDPIVFRGKLDVRGYWNGIRIISNNTLNRLEYVELHNGGNEGLGVLTSEKERRTSLMLDGDAKITVKNTTISSSQNYPFWIRGGGNLNIEFVSNLITGNEHAGWVDASYFHVLDGTSSFTGNDTDRIASGTDVTLTQNLTWKQVNVPYALPKVTFTEGLLTIEAGARFEANNDGYLYIRGTAGIKVLGEEDNLVVFAGQMNTRGSWRGMRIRTNNPENSLSFMEIRHAGQNGIGVLSSELSRITSLMLDDNVRISIDNIAIRDSREYAFWIRHVSNLIIEFSNNTFSGNEKLAMVDARYFHVLDGASSYSGNDDDIIRSESGTTASGNITWSKLDVPYELPNTVQVEGNLVIEAGARFESGNLGGLDILSTGSIKATGTPTDLIEFTGGLNTPGHWRGINVRSSSTSNEISYFVIRHAGSEGFGVLNSDKSRRQAVQVWGGYLKLSNGEITDSSADGIRSHAGGVVDRTDVIYNSINGENEVGF